MTKYPFFQWSELWAADSGGKISLFPRARSPLAKPKEKRTMKTVKREHACILENFREDSESHQEPLRRRNKPVNFIFFKAEQNGRKRRSSCASDSAPPITLNSAESIESFGKAGTLSASLAVMLDLKTIEHLIRSGMNLSPGDLGRRQAGQQILRIIERIGTVASATAKQGVDHSTTFTGLGMPKK